MLLIECPQAVDAYQKGFDVDLDLQNGVIIVAGKSFTFPTLPAEIIEIRNAGGLLEYTKRKLKNITKYQK